MEMELKEFVSRTLTEIAEGVAAAATAAAEFGAVVNPDIDHPIGGRSPRVVEIEFTVGLTVTDAAKTKGGIGVVAGIFALGSQGESNSTSGATTHIKFKVPMILPIPKVTSLAKSRRRGARSRAGASYSRKLERGGAGCGFCCSLRSGDWLPPPFLPGAHRSLDSPIMEGKFGRSQLMRPSTANSFRLSNTPTPSRASARALV
jgi:hypothetical protein